MNEDGFPIENGGFPNVMLVFWGVNSVDFRFQCPTMQQPHWIFSPAPSVDATVEKHIGSLQIIHCHGVVLYPYKMILQRLYVTDITPGTSYL